MDSMEASDWIAAVIALAALVVAGFSWRSSHRAAVAAEESAQAAKRTAVTEEALLKLERSDREQAALQERLDVWAISPHTVDFIELRFVGREAHGVQAHLDVEHSIERFSHGGGPINGPMFHNDTLDITILDNGWNRRVRVEWAESGDENAERLSKELVV